jgi:two-component system sensor histidine kinase TtrS
LPKPRSCKRCLTLAALLICLISPLPLGADHRPPDRRDVTVAVLAFRGTALAESRWTATMDYLSEQLPGVHFDAVAMDLEQLDLAVEQGTIDFAITNAGQFVRMGAQHGLTGLATLKSQRGHGHGPAIGATLLVRARSPYRELADLKGRRLGAVHPLAFGGFQIYWGEMARQGMLPERFFSQLDFSGFPVDALAYWLRDDQVDAAILPACLIERMDAEGLLRKQDFRPIGAIPHEGFDCWVSTPLYPNWFFASLRGTPPEISEQVAHALLTLPEDAPAAIAARSQGWTAPLSGYAIHQLLENLNIHPWQRPWWQELGSWLKRNWYLGLAGLLVAFAGLFHHLWVQYLVQKRTRALQQAHADLAHQGRELEHAQRVAILGELASDLAHELNQPLAAINSFAEGGMIRLKTRHKSFDPDALLQLIRDEAQRGHKIIDRVRGFARRQPARKEWTELRELVTETLKLLEHELNKKQPGLELVLELPSLRARVDPIEFQQVLVNLIRNGVEAMDDVPGPHRITITISEIAGARIELCVQDTGAGPPADPGQDLLKPFVSTKATGFGLGLSICQRILHAHGGTVNLAPAPGRGTRVTCTFEKGEADG